MIRKYWPFSSAPRIVWFLGLLALPSALAAQAPGNPARQPVTQSLAAFATRYQEWLLAAFDSIPENKYAYKPTPVQQSIGYVAQHIEDGNRFLCAQFAGLPWVRVGEDTLADTVKAHWPKAKLLARLRASFAYCDTAVSRVTDGTLADSVVALPASSGRKIVRARGFIAWDVDLVDHYSQIANYMRLNGMIPPSGLPRPGR